MSKKGLKDKDLARLQEIEAKHPADITPEEAKVADKLRDAFEKFGKYSK